MSNVFRIENESSGVCFLVMDVPNETVNTLNERFAPEFHAALDEIEKGDCKAVVLISGKSDCFVAGADIKMLQGVETAEQATALSKLGQEALQRLEDFDRPVVAAINGACLGGGLELALACHARVASDDRKTKLGLPEVQLGLLPGGGGTQRLPQLIGAQNALDLLLTGKQLNAKRALKKGLVDEVVPKSMLRTVSAAFALSMELDDNTDGSALERAAFVMKHILSKDQLQEMALEDNPIGRKLLFDQARKKVLAKTQGNYPAPLKIIDAVQAGVADGPEAGYAAEAALFGELASSPEAAELMRIFTTTTAMKKDSGVDDASVSPVTVKKIGMIGAGLMGAGIAYVTTAVAKIPVRLKDRDTESVGNGLSYVHELLSSRVSKKRSTKRDLLETMNQISPATDYSGLRTAQVVIEAVYEDLNLKQEILKDVEQHGGDDIIFASNTSTLPITKIAEASAHPETVIGMHYFSPVPKMPLLEVIRTDKTADWVVATCVELGKKQGKTVIVVNDGVGFYTSRILAPYMNEAMHILSEGIRIEDVDKAMLQFGFPVGPIKLADEVGIDVAQKASAVVKEAFGDRIDPPAGIDRLIRDNRLGRKNGRGFYSYGKKEKGPDESVYQCLSIVPANQIDDSEIKMRCVLQMVNEAAHCFGEGIVRSAADGDIAAIFGLGFPPFLGGPFRYADSLGAKNLVQMLSEYEGRFGARFRPAPILEELAKNGGGFYGPSDKIAVPGKVAA